MPGLVDRLLDASIVFSFDRSGYERHAATWRDDKEERSIHDLACLVTGANSGIGRATATALAQRGARIWLLCRNEARGLEAAREIGRETGNASIRPVVLDVSDLGAIRRFVAGFDEPRVDLLVHNAGVLPDHREETAEGIEVTLATNVVGPHLLTRLLEDKLAASADARVVLVSSGGMYPTRLSCEDLCWQRRSFDGVQAYAQTKRMQVVLAELYAERWQGSRRSCMSMHPGWADTPAVKTSIPRFYDLMRSRLRTAEQGADTVVWLATTPREQIASGRFYFDREPRTTHLVPFTRESEAQRRELWALCERLAGFAD